MDVAALASSMATPSPAQLQLAVGTAVLGTALDAAAGATLQLLGSMAAGPAAGAQSVPAGLTFSPAGLSPASSSRVIATL